MPELMPAGGWAGPSAPRLAAPPVSSRGLVFRSLSKAARLFGRADIPDIFSVMHINARLFWAWLHFASRLMPYGKLPGKLRETIIMRTAWNCRSRYEWGQHLELALKVGLVDADVVRISQGPEACTNALEQALLQACDEVHARQAISDATWAVLSEHYDDKLRIEIVMLIGHYIMVAAFLNSTGIALEAPIEALLQDFNLRADNTPP